MFSNLYDWQQHIIPSLCHMLNYIKNRIVSIDNFQTLSVVRLFLNWVEKKFNQDIHTRGKSTKNFNRKSSACRNIGKKSQNIMVSRLENFVSCPGREDDKYFWLLYIYINLSPVSLCYNDIGRYNSYIFLVFRIRNRRNLD